MEELGYSNALEKVFSVRRQRKKIYGDAWKKMEEYELVAMIKQKTMRLEYLLQHNNTENGYETEIDTLIDLVNYSLFLLEKKLVLLK